MSFSKIRWAALATVIATAHIACYNTYTIDTDELRKLEASVDRYETVEVLADCPDDEIGQGESGLDGTMLASAEDGDALASDGLVRRVNPDEIGGCTLVGVSTVNALSVLTTDGSVQRVTPFNFVMDDVQLVSPEYDVLVQLDRVEGAEVREFSGKKTVATITGATLLTVGAFVGITILAPEERGFN